MRSIKKIHNAESRPIGDLKTHSPLPSRTLQQIDPFIFLNHHGPQIYPPNNNGLPFGPHPHRGIETVTFIISGDIAHRDTSGAESVIDAGGIQWMTAGSGLIHAELSSDGFLQEGGELEILQLWINLPAKHKMTQPFYKGVPAREMVKSRPADGIEMDLIAGQWNGEEGSVSTLTDVFLSTMTFDKGTTIMLDVSTDRNIFFYVIKGKLEVNGHKISEFHLVEFNNDDEKISIKALKESILIFGHAQPLNEPMVAHGPFVMNTEEEIAQAYQDFREGKMGRWG
ncbi:pirin family protein [Robertkochia marina]|uniref:Pirin family protein n=1 Tax=Robertkochia marina TaxID=1227945 RepID=A0A4S3M0C7_9FLAO|nr:pirin family protein [Robertkochia marina]THD67791.1 pirin family protein [Robertkochia marina]TRZ41734.1 pirin family protein [Robertkochia marina]